ncbi:hypothetical protein BSF42_44630 [Flavobacterium sp. ACN6]|nr:hypothetical protein BSF42_44630 [Flavobacterium sp. ACN6]
MLAIPVPKLNPFSPSVSREASSAPVAVVPANPGVKVVPVADPSIIEPCKK